MTAAEQVALVRGLFDEWNSHRGELTRRHFDRNLVFDTRGLPQPDFQGLYRGFDQYLRWAGTWLSAWDNAQQTPVWIEVRANRVVAWVQLHLVGRYSGIADHPFGGWAFDFEGEKIVGIRLIAEEADALAYLTEQPVAST